MKSTLTRNVELRLLPTNITPAFVDFITENVKKNPGTASLRFKIYDPAEAVGVNLYTLDRGFTMNDDMCSFLSENPDMDVTIGLAG